MSFRASNVDYAGRLVDLELLQTVTAPNAGQRVYIGNVGSTPKIVTGIQKAVQRYVVALLAVEGDVHFLPEHGSDLLPDIAAGAVPNAGYLSHLFGIANAAALRLLAKDNNDTATFGALPDDEAITEVVLDAAEVDFSTGTILLQATLTTAAGEAAPFIVPISTAR